MFVRERVTVDHDGQQVVELQSRLAFGDHEDIDHEADDREVSAAVAGTDQRIRIVVDELLRGNFLEEVACADGTWSTVPVGHDYDDIARCAGANLSRCQGVCIGPNGPIGILDANGDGAIDDTRLIEGAVVLTCDGAAVPLDAQRSYYQPSGSQRLSTASVGTDSLGPAVVIVPAEGIKPNARCGITVAPAVVDKDGVSVCAPSASGCAPGDTAAIAFGVETFSVVGSDPHTGATDVPLHGEGAADAVITVHLNAAPDEATVAAAIGLTEDGRPMASASFTVAIDGHNVVITVPGGFRGGMGYQVTVAGGAGGIKDIYQDALAADVAITWTTTAAE